MDTEKRLYTHREDRPGKRPGKQSRSEVAGNATGAVGADSGERFEEKHDDEHQQKPSRVGAVGGEPSRGEHAGMVSVDEFSHDGVSFTVHGGKHKQNQAGSKPCAEP